jgi:hypothetical protein
MTRHSYEIKIIGSLGPATREAFADLVVEVEPTITVLSGDLDQSSLHEVLDRVRALGLELVEIKQAPDGRPALVHAIRQTPELDEFDAERHDAVERAVQAACVWGEGPLPPIDGGEGPFTPPSTGANGGKGPLTLVHRGSQHGVDAIGFDTEITERLTADLRRPPTMVIR